MRYFLNFFFFPMKAALAGKQVLFQGLEQQSVDARQALESEIQQLQQAKRSAKAAQQAASQALNHVRLVTYIAVFADSICCLCSGFK